MNPPDSPLDIIEMLIKGDANIGIVKYLISQGANINTKDSNGETPLESAQKVGG
jgi:ankyrin repeat protein